MAFRGLTKKGADYLATRLANQLPVEFLKVEIGNGAMAEGHNPKNQESLVSYKKQAKILKKIQENNAVNITIQITNEDITQGFYLKEIGIYVRENDTEKLYWYCNEDNAQYIPAKSDSVIAFEIDVRMEVTNSDTTIINWSGQETWVNKEYLEENYTQNGGYKGTSQEINDRLNSALGKHDGDFPVANAVVGNVYYSEVTKKYYKCKIGGPAPVPNGNFIDLSILENLNRLENLYNVKTYSYHNTEDVNSDMYIHYTVLKIMNICILEIKFARVANKDVIMPATPLPAEFRPKMTEYLSAIASTGGVKMDYHWLRLEPNGHFYTHNNAGITVRNLQTTIAYVTTN